MPSWCSKEVYERLFAEVAARDGMSCHWCKRPVVRHKTPNGRQVPRDTATLDHVVEIFNGGAMLDPANLVIACFNCNCNVRSGKLSREIALGLRVAKGKPAKTAVGTRGRRRRRRLIQRSALDDVARWDTAMRLITSEPRNRIPKPQLSAEQTAALLRDGGADR
jgi:hypothetical protein